MLRKRNALSIVEGLAVAAILIAIAAVLLIPQVQVHPHPPARRVCQNNLKQVALALLNYHQVHGCFPPAHTTDDKGNRLHSWRTLILPFVEQQPLYDSIDLTKPWDDPVNKKAYAAVIEVYLCPASKLGPEMTTYLAPVGPDWSFGTEEPRSLDVIDDETVLVMEVDPKRAVHWMSPYDFEDPDEMPFDSASEGVHSGSWMVALANGAVMSVDRTTPPEEVREMLSIHGKEKEPQ